MAFDKQLAFSMLTALALVTCGMTACTDEEEENDNGSNSQTQQSTKNDNCNKGKLGFAETCECLKTTTDWTKEGKKSIAEYLASICKLSTFFTEDDFQNKTVEEQGIGANCFCYGKNCSMAGYERPELQNSDGELYGCDNVPKEFNGAIRSCYRSTSIPSIRPKIYFPNGMCALTMSKCTPSEECSPDYDPEDCTPEYAKEKNEATICSFAKFGEYKPESLTACPEGSNSVLVDFVMNIEIITLGRKAKLDVRGCLPGCNTDADCKGYGVYDPITQEQSQLKCIETDAAMSGEYVGKKAKVCFDRRTVEDTDFGIVLVNPGNYLVEQSFLRKLFLNSHFNKRQSKSLCFFLFGAFNTKKKML